MKDIFKMRFSMFWTIIKQFLKKGPYVVSKLVFWQSLLYLFFFIASPLKAIAS